MPQPTWVTPAGNFGTYSAGTAISKTFIATPDESGNTLVYTILNGVFPNAQVDFDLDPTSGILTGVADDVQETTQYSFTIRVVELDGAIFKGLSDRTFSFYIQGASAPSFVTPPGALYVPNLEDSTWSPFQIQINNPSVDNIAVIRVIDGQLPPGIEINQDGLIRGYAEPPLDGLGNPTTLTYQFTLEVESKSGKGFANYSITIINQELIPGFIGRPPTILNTRPESYDILPTDQNSPYYLPSNGNIGTVSQDNAFIFKILGYNFDLGSVSYVFSGTLPPGLNENTYYNGNNVSLTVIATGSNYQIGDQLYIPGSLLGGTDGINDMNFTVTAVGGAGELSSVNSITGFNVDSNSTYLGLPVSTTTGIGTGAKLIVKKINPSWINGTIQITPQLIQNYSFSYIAFNNATGLFSSSINFTLTVVAQTNNVPFDPTVVWLTNSDLGTVDNGSISSLAVVAKSLGGLDLEYSLVSGTLPPNLNLLPNGDIVGRIAFEPGPTPTPIGSTNTFTFTIEAENSTYPTISTTREFTVTVYQNFIVPYENLYIKALLTVGDRLKLASLIQDPDIIPPEYVYRQNDPYFGVADTVIYQHMFGVPSSVVQDYVDAVNRNYYWRNIILGPIKTAVAKNSSGVVQYEVVYSEVVDDLVNNDGVSINKEITWPTPINGTTINLYPNSLPNMRKQIYDTMGQERQSKILPLWMVSQQIDGSSLGYKQAWVICYTKPGYSEIVKNNIVSILPGPINVISSTPVNNVLECTSTEGFYINMKVKFTGTSFGGIIIGAHYYIHQIYSETQFSISVHRNSSVALTLLQGTGSMLLEQVPWQWKLNELTFELDRFEVDRSFTYDYDPVTETWSTLPSPGTNNDSKDTYIYYPQKNVLN